MSISYDPKGNIFKSAVTSHPAISNEQFFTFVVTSRLALVANYTNQGVLNLVEDK